MIARVTQLALHIKIELLAHNHCMKKTAVLLSKCQAFVNVEFTPQECFNSYVHLVIQDVVTLTENVYTI